jgi:hypothetical protein
MNIFLQKEIKISPNHTRIPNSNLFEFILSFLKNHGIHNIEFSICPLLADGSQRMFWRVVLGDRLKRFIIMENPPRDSFSLRENKAYLLIGQHLFRRQIPVPEILFVDLSKGCFVLEDLGGTNLQERASFAENRIPLFQKVVEILLQLQIKGFDGFDPSWTCQTEYYDAYVMRRYEIEYFKEAFLFGFLGLKKEWPELEPAFRHLITKASSAGTQVFLHRDFQSRNIMILDNKIGILDWQGGRLGPPGYDLASLLIDPYTCLNQEEQNRIYSYYISLLEKERPGWLALFEETYPYLAFQRNLQILGAFAFLSRVRGKMHFVTYIPRAVESLRCLLQKLNDPELVALKKLFESIELHRHVSSS